MAFAKLIDFYKTDMTNDEPNVTEFMKTKFLNEILENENLGGLNLVFLKTDIEKELKND